MLNKIEIENFKCFREMTTFPLGAINLLTGTNGKGKSTLLQVLLLMRQSVTHNDATDSILINGECVSLGSFDDLRNVNRTKKSKIIFAFHLDLSSVKYSLEEDPDDDMVASINQIQLEIIDKDGQNLDYLIFRKENELVYDFNGGTKGAGLHRLLPRNMDVFDLQYAKHIARINEELSFGRIHYVGADRLGPQDFYFKSTLAKFPNVGAKGELTASVLQKKKNDPVHSDLCINSEANSALPTVQILEAQTELWLSYVFDGGKVEIRTTEGSNTLIAAYNADSSAKPRYKPVNVGFGFSYILPIIVSGLIAKSGEILIVENPEAHLHPKAQSRLIEFLAKVSTTGVQVFIESHSEHILNSLRVHVKNKTVTSRQAKVLYFHGKEEKPFDDITINQDGSIKTWPADFFDQTDKDLEKLFGI